MQLRNRLFLRALSFCFMLVCMLLTFYGTVFITHIVGDVEVYREQYQATGRYRAAVQDYAQSVMEYYYLKQQVDTGETVLQRPNDQDIASMEYYGELGGRLYPPAGSSLAWVLTEADGSVLLSNVNPDRTGTVEDVKRLTGGVIQQVADNGQYVVVGLRENTQGGDVFEKEASYFNILRQWMVATVIATVIVGTLFIMLFCYLLSVAGYGKGDAPAALTPPGYIFTELVLGGLFALAAMFIARITQDTYGSLPACSALLAGMMCLLFLLVHKGKAGKLYETSLLYPLMRMGRGVFRQIDLTGRFVGLILAYGIVQFFLFYAAFHSRLFFYISIITFLLFLGLLCIAAGQFGQLWRASERMAAGDFGHIIDECDAWLFHRVARNLNSASRAMVRAVESTMSSERLKTQLITNVSHDLNTPLTSIISYIGLLRAAGISDQKVLEYIDILDRKPRRLGQLMSDLVDIAKVSSGNIIVNMEDIDLSELLRQAVGEYESRAVEQGIVFVPSLPEGPVFIRADGCHMWRVLDNLLGNATKYTQVNTRVYIDVTERDGAVSLAIKNISSDPLNIPVEELRERFVRGDVARNTDGSGLGLSIAGSLVELQGGRMEIAIDGDLFKVELTLQQGTEPP